MEIKIAEKNVRKSADFAEVGCTIDDMDVRYVASLLRENYSDPVWAAVREIIANAVDACREAGSRLPLVTVPTKWASEFSVRDYGAGLTHDQVFGMYSKYGKSTKRGDNQGIGGFGIGRFAPLSYGDGFTVESFVDGECNIYTVRVDEHDDTRITQLARYKSDEPSGIRIVMPSKQSDSQRFAQMVKRLCFFGVKFDVNGIEVPDFDTLAPTILEKGVWSIRSLAKVDRDHLGYTNVESSVYSRYRSYSATHYIVMGGIPYPLDASNVTDKDAKKMLGMLSDQYSLIINLPIGSVHLHHSREALKYNDHVKNVVNEALGSAFDSVVGEMQKGVDTSTNFLEAVAKYEEYRVMLGGQFPAKLLWKGKELSTMWEVDGKWDSLTKKHPFVVQVRNYVKSEETLSGVSCSHGSTRGNFDAKVIYLYDDYATSKFKGRNLMRKVKYYLNQDDILGVKAFIFKEGDRSLLENKMKQNHFDELRSIGKLIDLSKAKEMALPKVKIKRDALPIRGIRIMGGHRYRIRDAWKGINKQDVIPDATVTKYYVKYERGYVYTHDNKCIAPNNFDRDGIISFLDLKGKDIYGITPTALKKISDKKDWVEITKLVYDKLDVTIKKMPKKVTLGDHNLSKFGEKSGTLRKLMCHGRMPRDTAFWKAFDTLRGMAEMENKNSNAGDVNYGVIARSISLNWSDMIKEITKTVSVKNDVQKFLDLADKFMPYYRFESRYYGYRHHQAGDSRLSQLYAFVDNVSEDQIEECVTVTEWALEKRK